MNLKKKIIMVSSLAILMSPMAPTLALDWQARTVDQVVADLVSDNNHGLTYTIQYGDTLSVIAEAMDFDVAVLAQVNDIVDADLIFPGTQLETSYNADQEAESVTITAPQEDGSADQVAEVNLEDQEVTFDGQSYDLDVNESDQAGGNLIEPVQEWVAPDDASQEVAETQAIVDPVDEWVAPTEAEASAAENDQAELELPESNQVSELDVAEVTEEGENAAAEVEADESDQALVIDEVVEPIEAETSEEATTPDESQTIEDALVPAEPEVSEEVAPAETETPEEVVPAETETTEPETPAEPAYDANLDTSGLQPQAAAFMNEVASIYGITSFSTYRPGDPGDHGQGKAVDFMVPESSALGDQVAQYAISRVGQDVSYVIWKQQIYGDWTGGAWKPMEDRGSVTANHYDHVHVSFY